MNSGDMHGSGMMDFNWDPFMIFVMLLVVVVVLIVIFYVLSILLKNFGNTRTLHEPHQDDINADINTKLTTNGLKKENCPNCGASIINSKENFCPFCGFVINK